MTPVDTAERVARMRAELTPVERRIADVLLAQPQAVAFGTVAGIAGLAGTSGASVVRFAAKLGYEGFTDLQSDVRVDLSHTLRPATERIRRHAPSDPLELARDVEAANVATTLGAVSEQALATATALLADADRPLVTLSGDAAAGVVATATNELRMLRPGVRAALGSPVVIGRELAHLGRTGVVLAVDLPRYDTAVLDGARLARAAGAALVVVTDRPMSPLADGAQAAFSAHAEGVGPFDSYVGVLALLNLLVAGVARQLQTSATDRLDRVESAWTELGALRDDDAP
jgi:DNA-binding MurR/RpiR family transcriptional regulator